MSDADETNTESRGNPFSIISELLILARHLSNEDSLCLPCSTSSALCNKAAGSLLFHCHFITETKALIAPDVFKQIIARAQVMVKEDIDKVDTINEFIFALGKKKQGQ